MSVGFIHPIVSLWLHIMSAAPLIRNQTFIRDTLSSDTYSPFFLAYEFHSPGAAAIQGDSSQGKAKMRASEMSGKWAEAIPVKNIIT